MPKHGSAGKNFPATLWSLALHPESWIHSSASRQGDLSCSWDALRLVASTTTFLPLIFGRRWLRPLQYMPDLMLSWLPGPKPCNVKGPATRSAIAWITPNASLQLPAGSRLLSSYRLLPSRPRFPSAQNGQQLSCTRTRTRTCLAFPTFLRSGGAFTTPGRSNQINPFCGDLEPLGQI
jgi:hypothetical protein